MTSNVTTLKPNKPYDFLQEVDPEVPKTVYSGGTIRAIRQLASIILADTLKLDDEHYHARRKIINAIASSCHFVQAIIRNAELYQVSDLITIDLIQLTEDDCEIVVNLKGASELPLYKVGVKTHYRRAEEMHAEFPLTRMDTFFNAFPEDHPEEIKSGFNAVFLDMLTHSKPILKSGEVTDDYASFTASNAKIPSRITTEVTLSACRKL